MGSYITRVIGPLIGVITTGILFTIPTKNDP